MKAICGIKFTERKRATNLSVVLGLNTNKDKLAIANSVC